MSFCVVRMAKFKAQALGGLQNHDRRAKESKTNPDIDISRSKDNYALLGHPRGLREGIDARAKELAPPNRKLRKDAIVCCGMLVTSDKDFFERLPAARQREFFQDSFDFLKNRYGEKNTVSATVHMDEKTPHMHFYFVPEFEGRLSAKDLFALPRKELEHLQTDFAREVGAKYGLERGREGSKAEHISNTRYKAQEAEKKLRAIEKRILTAEEVTLVESKGKKTLFGGLKGVSYQEFESLKLTAGKVNELVDRTQRAENNAQEARAKLQENLTWVEKEKKLIEDEKKRLAIEKEKTPDRFLLKRNQELSQENQALKTVLTYAKAFIRNLPKEFIKLLPEHQQERLVKIAETSKSLDKSQGLGR